MVASAETLLPLGHVGLHSTLLLIGKGCDPLGIMKKLYPFILAAATVNWQTNRDVFGP